MADAYDGFRWLWELDYSIEWFARHPREFMQHLGSGPTYKKQTIEFLDAALEHAAELTDALKKLREIAVNG